MQITFEEVRRAVKAYRAAVQAPIPKEHVPEPVQTSPEADQQLARELARQLVQMPDVREERVNEVKAKLASGTYRVSSEMVAGAIIRRALADKIR
ncbi:MAG: flagellar biosynthesis anti-sigma factor FlgM [Fimbriimonadales bacterium]|jgi:negative regulator of flagellin synthesis FlgM|nr:flagellar biosynthesis anti-sigma factor FlgM [Armatimonadota bacterium]MCX7687111.1 flagellar biosynthesis anti-sigma factor FlgM [Fimbriimonadales bacterium]CUU05012.1 anti-sigma-28 factor, FlgM family [Armatimonadetes bacterium GBS]CUU34200.1 anti-sigma-28 factor, FlgM family [Armatimonadetes bacterium DC]CUU36318.1 anti-sigma-28 factor, FlgM family [Armatimonadetes bacterium GXS]GBC90308.1 hypothetical protein HRbin14_01043 [bacterium HR14]